MGHPDKLIETNSMLAMLKCSICKLLMQNPQSLRRCGHTFCFGCINQALAIGGRCPECRKDVNEIDVTQPSFVSYGQKLATKVGIP